MESAARSEQRERNAEAQRAFALHLAECARCQHAEDRRWRRTALCFTGAHLKSEAIAARRAVSAR